MLPPVSKSDAIRALILRYIRRENLDFPAPPHCTDVEDAIGALQQLESDREEVVISIRLGAAPLRFVVALAVVTPGRRIAVDARPALRARPLGELVEALRRGLSGHGLKIRANEWPLRIDTTNLQLPHSPSFSVEPTSSQYPSALALAGAEVVRNRGCVSAIVEMLGESVSTGYLDLTIRWMRSAGFDVEQDKNSLRINGFSPVEWVPRIPRDWSAVAYLLAWAWKSGAAVDIGSMESHPDAAVVPILRRAGLDVELSGDLIRVAGELTSALDADAAKHPDLVPTLAVLALAAPVPSRFDNVEVLRHKESDRLQFILDLVGWAGGKADLSAGRLTISPPASFPRKIFIRTEDDHRRAMAGSILAAICGAEVFIDDPDCVDKSFPGYWDEIMKCGAIIETASGGGYTAL